MNKAQKEVQQSQLDEEKKVIRLLQKVYEQTKKDCEQKIRELSARTDLENLQSTIYQREYQQLLVDQLESILYDLHEGQFTTIADYLQESYVNGYTGVYYDLSKTSGIPLVIPIRQDLVVKAVQTDSKLSSNLYTRLGEDVNYLKRSVRAELSRGVASGSSWNEMAVHIAKGMNSPFKKSINNAIRIARTEGHRIQNTGALDGQSAAKKKGADILKQWDATLDGRTRPEHQEADGQIRETDEPFDVGGEKMRAPGVGGSARNVCNCRCCLLSRARWALDEDELDTLKERAAFFGLDKTKDFEEFKKKYCQLPDNADTMEVEKLPKPTGSKNTTYDSFFKMLNDELKVKYNAVESHKTKLTPDDIIKKLAGGDLTQGSCASVGLAYIGQKQGWNVLDFRGNKSREFFSRSAHLCSLSKVDGMKTLKADGKSSLTVGNRLLKKVEVGKEYYLCVGRHASIVRKTSDGKLQYLELQSAEYSGWRDFDGNPKYTLSNRFGCTSRSDYGLSSTYDFMLDLEESDFLTDDFKALLGYINTSDSDQKKGTYGTIK